MMNGKFWLFLVANFMALAIGSFFMGDATSSNWYLNLVRAPWTPPGWMFGPAWTIIMICFAFFMSEAWKVCESPNSLLAFYLLQWTLNAAWPILFFQHQLIFFALYTILLLTVVVGLFLFRFKSLLRWKIIFITPYFIWLILASSLNAYICIYN